MRLVLLRPRPFHANPGGASTSGRRASVNRGGAQASERRCWPCPLASWRAPAQQVAPRLAERTPLMWPIFSQFSRATPLAARPIFKCNFAALLAAPLPNSLLQIPLLVRAAPIQRNYFRFILCPAPVSSANKSAAKWPSSPRNSRNTNTDKIPQLFPLSHSPVEGTLVAWLLDCASC